MENDTKRIFIGVPIILNDAFRMDYQNLKKYLAHCSISWVNEVNMHITLQFIGDISNAQIEQLMSVINQTDLSIGMSLEASGLGVFKSVKQAKVLFVCVDEFDLWDVLFTRINKICAELGLVNPESSYTPHITLGRIRRSIQKNLIGEILERFNSRFIIQQDKLDLCLYESILKKSGAEYNVLFTKAIS